jgi:hypothetical protein
MKGTTHTLTATITSEGTVSIVMASLASRPLIQALENSIKQVENMGNSAPKYLLIVLQGILAAANQDKKDMRENWKAQGAKPTMVSGDSKSLGFEKFVDQELTGLMQKLIELANKYDLHDLQSYFTKVPEKRYLPSNYDVRRRLYEGSNSGWSNTQKSTTRNDKNSIRTRVIKAQRDKDSEDFDKMKDQGKFIPEDSEIGTFKPDGILNSIE